MNWQPSPYAFVKPFRRNRIGRFLSYGLWVQNCAQRCVTSACSVSCLLAILQRPILAFSAVKLASARRVQLIHMGGAVRRTAEQSFVRRKSWLIHHWIIRRSQSDSVQGTQCIQALHALYHSICRYYGSYRRDSDIGVLPRKPRDSKDTFRCV